LCCCVRLEVLFFCFFFQAEDGIRDRNVTGVQTCALPILTGWATAVDGNLHVELAFTVQQGQWQQDVLLVQLVREVVVQATAIDDDFTGTRDHAYASNCALTTTNGLDWALVQDWSFSFGLSGCLWSDRIT